MLACLLAAMMSSADTYMIVTSGLITRNVYAAYVNPNASERTYVRVARLTGLVIIVGASVVAITMGDVFGQFKLAVELPVLFAAPFWIGMYWRRANRIAVWITISFSLTLFFILPIILSSIPALRTSPSFTQTTDVVTRTITRTATAADVARREAWVEATAQAHARNDRSLLKKLGSEPPKAEVGEPIRVVLRTGGSSIFWSGGVEPIGEPKLEVIEETTDARTTTLVQRHTGPMAGSGQFKVDLLIYQLLGFDLSRVSKATLETLRLPTRLLLPFIVLIVASYFTPRNSTEALDRYFAKMKTEVHPNHEEDLAELEKSYADPHRFDDGRIFPGTDWEFMRPKPKDIIGFLAAVAACFVIIGILVGLAGIGAAG
jgi:SSS family solute:Na+ symporter